MGLGCRRSYLRPEVPVETAIVALMDARGVLYELRVTPSPPPACCALSGCPACMFHGLTPAEGMSQAMCTECLISTDAHQ